MDDDLKQYLDKLSGRIEDLSERNTAEFRQFREENAQFREEVGAEFKETRRVLRGEMSEMATTLRGEFTEKISAAVSTLRGEMAAAHAETRRHFDITVEHWETRFDLLSEAVQMVDQKVDRQGAELREEIALISVPRRARARRTKR